MTVESVLERTRARLAEADRFDERSSLPDVGSVATVIAVVASSRGGSSLLHEMLSASPGALSIGGEHTALYKLNGVERGLDGSDALSSDVNVDLGRIRRDMTSLLRINDPVPSPRTDLAWTGTVLRRLALQWPHAEWDPDVVVRAVEEAGPDPAPLARFHSVVRQLNTAGVPIDAAYYDWPDPTRDKRTAPPFDAPSFEEPPFVVPSIWRAPCVDEIRHGTLVLKASVDAYRLSLLRRLFPNSALHLVHLLRNPAASINGLIDGWHDRGFFSYDVSADGRLDIAGYRELGEFASRWWKFDLPPKWREVRGATLAEVAAVQWAGAHRAILDGLTAARADAVSVIRFEDLLDPSRRAIALRRVMVPAGLGTAADGPLPEVMVTRSPRPGRWRDRALEIAPALASEDVLEVARELGYAKESSWV